MDYCGYILTHQHCPVRTVQERVLCRRQETIKKKPKKLNFWTSRLGNDYKTSCDFPEESTEVHENFLYYT